MQQLLRKRRIRFNQTVKRSSRGSDSITPERPQGHSRTAPSCFIRGPAAFSEYSYQIATVAVGWQIYELTGSATSAFETRPPRRCCLAWRRKRCCKRPPLCPRARFKPQAAATDLLRRRWVANRHLRYVILDTSPAFSSEVESFRIKKTRRPTLKPQRGAHTDQTYGFLESLQYSETRSESVACLVIESVQSLS